MKLAPAFDVLSFIQRKLPIDMGLHAFNQEIKSSYASFVKVPYLKESLAYLGLDAHSFMITLGIFDLICAMLIFLPKGRRPALVVGNWMIAQMIGAEYCVRKSGFYMSSVRKMPQYFLIMTLVHGYLSCEGLQCMRSDALGLSGWVWSFLTFPTHEKKKKEPVDKAKKVSDSATTEKMEQKVEERGRAVAPVGSSKNRSSTPGALPVKKTN